ncbi:MAG TPA: hypothetical protein VM536_09960 [Chloroflexia bacterium]|nr:hypothetical protein [Chloroflexia bacterium]
MLTVKKVLLGAALAALLGLGALFGTGPTRSSLLGHVPVAHAEDCDTTPPGPGLDCLPPTPTPTVTH